MCLPAFNWLHATVRSNLSANALIPQIRRAIQRVNPSQPILDIATMDSIARSSIRLQRATSFLTLFFAGVALLLAALGVYGVVAYSVRQRTVEFGTRMALGAVSRDLFRLVLGGGLRMAVGGLVLGALAVIAITVILMKSSVIHSVGSSPYIYSTLVIAAIAVVASVYPAWRATQLSPMVAIRNEPEIMWLRTRDQMRRVATEISSLLSGGADQIDISEQQLLTGFVEATRRAESSENALFSALEALCGTLGARTGMLLEGTGDGKFFNHSGLSG